MGAGGTFERMARIALNGRLLVPGKLEGIGRFTLNSLRHLVALRPDDAFLLVVDRPEDEMFRLGPNVEVVRIRIPARRPWLIRWWLGRPMRRVLQRWKAEAFVSLEGPLASGMPDGFPQLSVIHDLNFEHRPEDLPAQWSRFYRTDFPNYARQATLLGTVSEYSRQDLASTYGLDAQDIRVFPNAADASFVPTTEDSRLHSQRVFASGAPYFVYVGSLHPRKNIDGLLKAFQHYRDAGGGWDLVLVGVAMWSDDLPSLPEEVQRRVHFAGRLNHGAWWLRLPAPKVWCLFPGSRGLAFPWWKRCRAAFPWWRRTSRRCQRCVEMPPSHWSIRANQKTSPRPCSTWRAIQKPHPKPRNEACAARKIFHGHATGQALSDALNDMMSVADEPVLDASSGQGPCGSGLRRSGQRLPRRSCCGCRGGA